MKALCWHAAADVRLESVPDPSLLSPRDAIVRVSLSGLSGADLHLYHGRVPAMAQGDIIGHEFCGEVVEVGPGVQHLEPGDRVVLPSVIACGGCFHCHREEWSLCDNSNPNARLSEQLFGFSAAGIFGYTHLFGGYAGGDAEYVRVPFADVGARKIPDNVSDEQALLTCDVLPTGKMAADMCGIQAGDTVAVWGAGPVGQAAILAAYQLGAERVIAIDPVAARREMARRYARAEPLDGGRVDVVEALRELTAGRGPDACIDAVGLGSDATSLLARERVGLYGLARQALWLDSERPSALREAILACRKGGVVAVVGTYAGRCDELPLEAAISKGLTLRMGLAEGHKYMGPLLEGLGRGEFDPSYLITHRFPLTRARDGFRLLESKADDCLKVLLRPE
jgi:threonine dehydrogenase-like Zn-dependent dehydrogenase